MSQGLSSLTSNKVGTTGVAFLKIPCGARSIGMDGLVQLGEGKIDFSYLKSIWYSHRDWHLLVALSAIYAMEIYLAMMPIGSLSVGASIQKLRSEDEVYPVRKIHSRNRIILAIEYINAEEKSICGSIDLRLGSFGT